MPFELQYTSAPHGLFPGQSGLATVKMTKGMPLPLRESLESLSSYHGASIEHAGSKQFQCSSLLQFAAGGSRWYVLSRSAYAGLDYTHRQTFFVHHVAFSPEETAGLDPLSLLNAAGFLQSSWDGRVEEIAVPPRVPHQMQPNAQFNGPLTEQWKAFIVDEALAGKLIYLITPENSSLVLAESLLAAAPSPQRWSVTFMTRFQSLSPAVKCAVRCLPPGTPLPTKFDRSQTMVVDATGPLGPAPQSRVVASRQPVPEARAIVTAMSAAHNPKPMPRQPSLTTAEERWQNEATEFVRPDRRSAPAESPAGYSFGQGIALGAVTALIIGLVLAAIIILSLQSRIAERDQTISDKTAELAKFQTDFNKLLSLQQTTAGELESLKGSTSQKTHLLEENQKTQNDTIDSLENKLNDRDANITRLNKQIDDQKASINSLTADLNSLKTEKEKLSQQLKDEQAKQKNNQPDKDQNATENSQPSAPAPTPTTAPQTLIPDFSEKTKVIPISIGPLTTISKIELTGLPPSLVARQLVDEKGLKCALIIPDESGAASKSQTDVFSFTYPKNDGSVTFTWQLEAMNKLPKQQQDKIKAALEAAVLKVIFSSNQTKEIKLSGQK